MKIRYTVIILLFSGPLLAQTDNLYYKGIIPHRQDLLAPALDTISVNILSFHRSGNDTIHQQIISTKDNVVVSGDSIFMAIHLPSINSSDSFLIQPVYHVNKSVRAKGDKDILFKGKSESATFVKLTIQTTPEGSNVYMIPKIQWIDHPEKYWLSLPPEVTNKPLHKPSPVTITLQQQYVFEIIYENNGRVNYKEYAANYNTPIDTVIYSFSK